ncbi:MAG: Gfo/Idh/MocA family oxidoreductase [Candidatus Omnitrophica bacterium]|nr:Gfo/Idh/MocA family oxidoreductase [Candidatus Omnitrophota bacterium]
MKLKIGVVGLGIGQVHLRYYQKMPEVELAGVVDTNPDILNQVSRDFSVRPFSSVEQFIREAKPDGVSLCTPPASHLPLSRILAKAGIHILCEKPMAPTAADCEKMIEICQRNKVFLMLGFKKRFSPTYQFLKENFAGEFGPAKWLLAKFALGRVTKKWFWEEKDGGGPIMENTVHMVDLLHFLVGKVELVFAVGGNLFMPEFAPQIDTAIFTLRFTSGAIAGVGAGYASEWGFAREELSFATEKVAGQVSDAFDRPEKLEYIFRSKPAEVYQKRFENSDGFEGEIRHFIECVKNGTEPVVNGEHGLAALKLCQAVKKSIRQGKPVLLNKD